MIEWYRNPSEINYHTYFEEYDRKIVEEKSGWFDKWVYKRKRRCFMVGYDVFNQYLTPKYLKFIAQAFDGINKYQIIEKSDLINGAPDLNRVDKWITVSKDDLLKGNVGMYNVNYGIFPEYEDPRLNPKIRRAIEYVWFDEQTCEKYPCMQQLEFYLKNHCDNSLALNLRKRLENGGYDMKSIINCWTFIRLHLQKNCSNWLPFFLINYYRYTFWRLKLEEVKINKSPMIKWYRDPSEINNHT
jgi:hypothetical protein